MVAENPSAKSHSALCPFQSPPAGSGMPRQARGSLTPGGNCPSPVLLDELSPSHHLPVLPVTSLSPPSHGLLLLSGEQESSAPALPTRPRVPGRGRDTIDGHTISPIHLLPFGWGRLGWVSFWSRGLWLGRHGLSASPCPSAEHLHPVSPSTLGEFRSTTPSPCRPPAQAQRDGASAPSPQPLSVLPSLPGLRSEGEKRHRTGWGRTEGRDRFSHLWLSNSNPIPAVWLEDICLLPLNSPSSLEPSDPHHLQWLMAHLLPLACTAQCQPQLPGSEGGRHLPWKTSKGPDPWVHLGNVVQCLHTEFFLKSNLTFPLLCPHCAPHWLQVGPSCRLSQSCPFR